METFLFSKTVDLLAKSVDMRTKKHAIIAGNVANSETPGYTPRTLSFERELKAALEGCAKPSSALTHPRHLPIGKACHLSQVTGIITETPGATPGGDGNSIELEAEMAKMAENQIMYNASVQLLARKLEGLKSAIRGGQ